jgi:hypothetical protein
MEKGVAKGTGPFVLLFLLSLNKANYTFSYFNFLKNGIIK